ncbi:MAG TPA: LacI family DNA-binding transcriptional regulator, partial [Sphaerochaeta sp.]|nr:LacI family DNA-binding transcriptional regulator [Sphaerochaeta sp.]
MKKEFKRVTLQDVAKAAEVSYASVSAVLNDKIGPSIRVSEKTRKKILACADRLGYIPNIAARRLKSGHNSLIAVFTYEQIFPIESENEFYRFFVGVQESAAKLGYDLLILNNRPTEESSRRAALADGAVMIGVNRDDRGIKRLIQANFPLVFVGRREVGEERTHWVTFDYETVINQMVDHLAPYAKSGTLIYIESQEQEREPRRDKRRFLLAAAEANNVEVEILYADAHNRISDATFARILEVGVVIFDRIFLLDPFEERLAQAGVSLGVDLRAAVFEDDWQGTHTHWTRWTNQR